MSDSPPRSWAQQVSVEAPSSLLHLVAVTTQPPPHSSLQPSCVPDVSQCAQRTPEPVVKSAGVTSSGSSARHEDPENKNSKNPNAHSSHVDQTSDSTVHTIAPSIALSACATLPSCDITDSSSLLVSPLTTVATPLPSGYVHHAVLEEDSNDKALVHPASVLSGESQIVVSGFLNETQRRKRGRPTLNPSSASGVRWDEDVSMATSNSGEPENSECVTTSKECHSKRAKTAPNKARSNTRLNNDCSMRTSSTGENAFICLSPEGTPQSKNLPRNTACTPASNSTTAPGHSDPSVDDIQNISHPPGFSSAQHTPEIVAKDRETEAILPLQQKSSSCDQDFEASSSSTYRGSLGRRHLGHGKRFDYWEGFHKKEVVTLLMQTLGGLGYVESLNALEKESGCSLESPFVQRLHRQVVSKEWTAAVKMIENADIIPLSTKQWCYFLLFEQMYLEHLYEHRISEALHCLRSTRFLFSHSTARWCLFSGHFLPFGMYCFSENLVGLANVHPLARSRLTTLSGFLVFSDSEALCQEACWSPSHCGEVAWRQITKLLPPNVSPPLNRLAVSTYQRSDEAAVSSLYYPSLLCVLRRLLSSQYLLHQAVRFQELRCLNHNTAIDLNAEYAQEHTCSATAELPRRCVATLERHEDEVWNVCVSHDGHSIVTGAADGTVILWKAEFPNFTFVRQYNRHRGPVLSLAWSSDDRYFAASTAANGVKIWDIHSDATCQIPEQALSFGMRRISSSRANPLEDNVLGFVTWVPNRHQLIASGCRRVVLFSIRKTRKKNSSSSQDMDPPPSTGDSTNPVQKETKRLHAETLRSWVFRKGVQDVQVNYTGEKLLVCLSDKTIRVLALHPKPKKVLDRHSLSSVDGDEETIFTESDITTSLCASRISDQFLVSVSEDRPVIRLWDIPTGRVLQRYTGHQQRQYVLSASFGGYHESFVVSGSEDAKIYIWNRLYGCAIACLTGHVGTVTAVHWRLGLDWLVTGSDDCHVRVWHSGRFFKPHGARKSSSHCGPRYVVERKEKRRIAKVHRSYMSFLNGSQSGCRSASNYAGEDEDDIKPPEDQLLDEDGEKCTDAVVCHGEDSEDKLRYSNDEDAKRDDFTDASKSGSHDVAQTFHKHEITLIDAQGAHSRYSDSENVRNILEATVMTSSTRDPSTSTCNQLHYSLEHEFDTAATNAETANDPADHESKSTETSVRTRSLRRPEQRSHTQTSDENMTGDLTVTHQIPGGTSRDAESFAPETPPVSVRETETRSANDPMHSETP